MARVSSAILTAGVISVVALVHVYWAVANAPPGAAVPERDGAPLFRPGRVATAIVSVLLFLSATLVLAAAGLLRTPLPPTLATVGCDGVAAVFALRALGDFRWVGFFKTVRTTRFAILDTRCYSPLCLALAAGCLTAAHG